MTFILLRPKLVRPTVSANLGNLYSVYKRRKGIR